MNLSESLDHVLRLRQPFGQAFYRVFFERFPEVQSHFQGLDISRQHVVLTMTLTVICQHYLHRYPATSTYLAYLGTHHHDRNIPEDLFPRFREALLATLADTLEHHWTETLANEWRQAIDLAAEQMLTGYQKRVII